MAFDLFDFKPRHIYTEPTFTTHTKIYEPEVPDHDTHPSSYHHKGNEEGHNEKDTPVERPREEEGALIGTNRVHMEEVVSSNGVDKS